MMAEAFINMEDADIRKLRVDTKHNNSPERIAEILIGAMKLARGGDSAVYEPCPRCSSDCGVFSSGPKRTGEGCTTCDKWNK